MDYKKLAYDLLPLLGGKDNISKLTHCATRLRFEFYDLNKVDVNSIEKTNGVISVVEKGGQFQVVVGNDVTITYRALVNEMGGAIGSNDKNGTKQKKSIINNIVSGISSVVAWIMGFGDIEKEQFSKSCENIEMDNKEIRYAYQGEVFSPITGEAICLSDVPDAVFSQRIMGNGIAIKPSEGKVYAPFDGEIVSLFETKHAIGLISDTGIELLIHVGIDTVKLGGKFYEAHMKAGDKIKCGDLILTFDKQQIEDVGFDVITPIIITNTDKFPSIDLLENQVVSHGDKIISVKNRK